MQSRTETKALSKKQPVESGGGRIRSDLSVNGLRGCENFDRMGSAGPEPGLRE